MNPWTALLESIHSAVIDELNERFPDIRPVLGLPSRCSEWKTLDPDVARYLVFDVEIQRQRGLAAVGLAPPLERKLKTEVFWEALIKRADSEFHRRGIQPRFGSGIVVAPQAPLPKSFTLPSRVIWIPIVVDGDPCVFGIGI